MPAKTIGILVVILCNIHALAATVTVQSPDGTVEMTVRDDAALSYSVKMDGRPIVLDSALLLELADGTWLGKTAKVVSNQRTEHDEQWHAVVGRRSIVANKYNQVEILLQEAGKAYSLFFRAYDDGVAFRWGFGKDFGDTITVQEEHSEFTFGGNHTCWPAFLNHYKTEHQALYPQETLSGISPEDIIGPPLTIQLADDQYCSITEAALTDWAGMYLTREGKSEPLAESEPVVRGGQPYVVKAQLPKGTRKIRIVIDAAGSDTHDHVDIADAKLTTADGKEIWLSDLEPILARQEWGQLGKDKSVDGNPLKIAGKSYEKGLGTHSSGVIVYKLAQECRQIEAVVGIDEEVQQEGKAIVRLYAVQEAAESENIALKCTLSRLKERDPAVKVQTPHVSPWRVVMLGRKPVDLVNSDIVLNLNEPAKIEDTTWIQPGVSSWNWLNCGGEMDMPLLKKFVDLSASMGWEYVLVDDGWYKGWNCTEPIDKLDIPELVSYAAQKNVRIWLWVHWQALNEQMDEAFNLYEKWQIAGIKTDFMSRDDQWMVNWYHTVLESAARHKLMINFHGCYKPTGIRRTWPNLMTREAVFGEEQNLGSRQNDPVHKTTLPFTRMLAGPMDYTPGSMLNETRESWTAGRPVKTLGTRGQELAICVIYDNPVLSMADRYDHYEGQKGAEFLKDLPASWDDTQVLEGQIGQFIVSARRKADTWYAAGITNWDERTVEVQLEFLGPGKYTATIYEDGPDARNNARDIQVRFASVSSENALTVKMASGGGFAVILKKSE